MALFTFVTESEKNFISQQIRLPIRLIKNYQNLILVFFSLLTVFSLYFTLHNKVNSNPFSYFDKEVTFLKKVMDINNRVSLENEALRMTTRWNLVDTKDWLEKLDLFMKKGNELGLNLYVTGKSYLFHHMIDYVVATFFNSITLAMVLVSILMMLIFKSVKLGLLSLIPNIIPLLIGGAVMYFFKMDLNIGTSLVASVCLGIAVDDTIHFLSNYYILKKKGVPDEQALAKIFTFTGRALYITSLILVLSFGMFIFGNFVPNVNFGVISAIVLSMAFIIDVIFLLALLLKISSFRGETPWR